MVRPSFSYATIILLTLLNHPDQSLNLGDIYHWIKTNFLYYSQEDESWQVIHQVFNFNVFIAISNMYMSLLYYVITFYIVPVDLYSPKPVPESSVCKATH